MGLLPFLLVDINQQHAVLVLTFACVPVAMWIVVNSCISGSWNAARMGVLYLNLEDRMQGNMMFYKLTVRLVWDFQEFLWLAQKWGRGKSKVQS